jgi:hypothetical protein
MSIDSSIAGPGTQPSIFGTRQWNIPRAHGTEPSPYIVPGDMPVEDDPIPTPVPHHDIPDDPNEPPVQRSQGKATLRAMRQSSGAAFADSAYFSGLFEQDGSPEGVSHGVKPDWSTIGIAGGTVAGLGGLYHLAGKLETVDNAARAGQIVTRGAARTIGNFGKLALFATPIVAAGVAAPAIADLAHFAAPNLVKQNQEVPADATQSQRNRINNNNDDAWMGRVAVGALSVGVLGGAALLLHRKPIPGPAVLDKLFGGGLPGALRGAAALGLIGGVSAGAFYNVFDANGDIVQTHSPLRSY